MGLCSLKVSAGLEYPDRHHQPSESILHTAYISHSDCLKHDTGPHHPECAERLMAIEDQLIASGLMHFLQRYDAPCATLEQLARVHTQQHIEAMHAAVPTEGLVHLDPDTVMSPTSLSAALRAAGAVVMAADLVLEGKSANAFCAVRPPGVI